jgi:predicted Rossmann-fold nucleotide-binding protein
MKYKVGVFGSAEGDLEKLIPKARQLGRFLSEKNTILITGASNGLPYEAAKIAHANGAEVWGFSKGTDLKTQEERNPGLDSSVFSKFIYIPKDYEFAENDLVSMKYRNVTSTATCDAGVIISGRWGSLNEFTNLYDMGKIIGVLTGTGGIADELEALSKKIHKPGKAKVIFNSNPNELVKDVILTLKNG